MNYIDEVKNQKREPTLRHQRQEANPRFATYHTPAPQHALCITTLALQSSNRCFRDIAHALHNAIYDRQWAPEQSNTYVVFKRTILVTMISCYSQSKYSREKTWLQIEARTTIISNDRNELNSRDEQHYQTKESIGIIDGETPDTITKSALSHISQCYSTQHALLNTTLAL